MKMVARRIWLVVAVVFAGWFAVSMVHDAEWRESLSSAKTADEYVVKLVNQPDAKVRAVMVGDALDVKLNIDPWALTKSTTVSQFNYLVQRVVPKVFEKFSNVNRIRVDAFGTFVDVRGNKSENRALAADFTRLNARSINWDNVLNDNIPKLADSYWRHPGFDRE